MIETRPPTEADIDALVAGMRQQDVDELHAGGTRDIRRVVADGIRRSVWCLTATVDGQVACVFGLAPMGSLLDSRGVPWMLGTDLVPKHRRALARLAPVYIRRMLQTHPHLLNVVHAKNLVAAAWLKRVGFDLHPAAPYGPHGEPFHLFEMHSHV